MAFLDSLWLFLASLVYAFLDFIVIEVIMLSTFKLTKNKAVRVRNKIKKSEYFVFGTISLALIYFYISNALQDWSIMRLITLKAWLFLIIIILFLFSVFLLAKFVLDRNKEFRLVIVPLIIIGFIIVMTIIFTTLAHIN
ncbi:MAG: hypothetical protein KJ939_03870 [Nanoarchaeota archaeon]|nr:hypothetical protein [Nanoarchaeota archaeon]